MAQLWELIAREKVLSLITKLIEMSYTHPTMHATNPIVATDTFATPASPDERALFDMLRTITRPSDHSTLTRPGTNSYLPDSVNGTTSAPTHRSRVPAYQGLERAAFRNGVAFAFRTGYAGSAMMRIRTLVRIIRAPKDEAAASVS